MEPQQNQGQNAPEEQNTPAQEQQQAQQAQDQGQRTEQSQGGSQGGSQGQPRDSQGQFRSQEETGERQQADPDPRRFTQADLDKIAGNVRKEAREAARQEALNELLKEVGAGSTDELKSGYQEYLEVSELAKTELEKAQERIKKLEEDGASKEKLAQEYANLADKRLVDSRLATELQKAGLNPERLKLALRNVGREGLKVEEDDVTGLEEAVAALKDESPEWFQQPKKQYTAADASNGKPQPIDFRTASDEAYKAEMRRLGVKP